LRAFCAAFLAVTFVVAFATAFVATAFLAGTFSAELLFLPGFRPVLFGVIDAGAALAALALLDGRPLTFGLLGGAPSRPTTVSVPGPGTKRDWSPDGHRTVITRPRTSVTTPVRATWPTFVATN